MHVISPFNEQYSLVLRAAWGHQLTFPFKDFSSSWQRSGRGTVQISDQVVPYHGRMGDNPYWQCHDCHEPIVDEAGKPIWNVRDIEEFEEDYISEEKKTGEVLTETMVNSVENQLQLSIQNVPNVIDEYFEKHKNASDDAYFSLSYDINDQIRNLCNMVKERIGVVERIFFASLHVKGVSLYVPHLSYSLINEAWKKLENAVRQIIGPFTQLQMKHIRQVGGKLIVNTFKRMIMEGLKPFFEACQVAINKLKSLVGLEGIEVQKSKILLPLCNKCSEEARFYCAEDDCDFHTTDEDDIIEVELTQHMPPDAEHQYYWNKTTTNNYCEEHAAKCESCGNGVLKDDEAMEYENDWYHQECFNEVYRYCDGCDEYRYTEDMMWDEDSQEERCPNCYEDRDTGVDENIEKDDLKDAAEVVDKLPKLFPLDEKTIETSILPALKLGLKKLQSNPTMPFDKQLAFVLKRIQRKEAQNAVLAKSRSMDSLHNLYEYFSEHQKELAKFKDKYPKLKGFKPLPVDIKIENSAMHHAGKVFAVYPSEEFLDYAELMQPGAKAVYEKYISHRGHHPGSLAFARFSMSDGNIIIDNLQTDIDVQTYKSTFQELDKDSAELALRWWLTAIKKFWIPALLDALNKFGKEIEKKVYLTTFQMQKSKWNNLPERNKDVYDRIPDIMQFPTEQIEAKPEDLIRRQYTMRRVANSLDKGAYAYYKLAQLL